MMKHQVKILDSELRAGKFGELLTWFHERYIDHHTYYEPDGDHDGYWVFTFEKEEDKVKFILQWM